MDPGTGLRGRRLRFPASVSRLAWESIKPPKSGYYSHNNKYYINIVIIQVFHRNSIASPDVLEGIYAGTGMSTGVRVSREVWAAEALPPAAQGEEREQP